MSSSRAFGDKFEKTLITLSTKTLLHKDYDVRSENNLKKTITCLVLLALIIASSSWLLSPSARADPSEIKVLSYSWYVAPATSTTAVYPGYDLVAVGEVQNVGSNIVGSAFVNGFASNSTGTILDATEARVSFSSLQPGQKAPFYIDFSPENTQAGLPQDDSWVPNVTSVTVEPGYVSDTNSSVYSGLTILSPSNVDSGGEYTVTGTLQNTGSEIAQNIFVDTTFYNSSGTVVAMNVTSSLTSLATGNSERFVATPMDNTAQLSSKIANYTLLIQATSATTSASPSPTSSTSSTPTSTATSTQPTQSPTPISLGVIYVAVGVVVAVVVVLAVLMLFRRSHKNAELKLPPPPPPPPSP